MPNFRLHRRWLQMFWLLAIGCLGGLVQPALGQENTKYRTLPYDQAVIRENSGLISQINTGAEPLDANGEKFDRFFKALFGQMTQLDATGDYAKLRQIFLGRYRLIRRPDVLERLNQITLSTMREIVKGNFHPAARYNATLIIGELDQELGVATEKSAPVPLAGSGSTLLICYENSHFPDYVRVAALDGLERHLRYRTLATPAEQERLIKAMVALVGQKAPPGKRQEVAHRWMRRQAVEILGTVGNPGPKNEVVSALAIVCGDSELPLSLRCAAAEALGRLRYPEGDQPALPPISKTLACLAEEVCVYEQFLAAKQKAFPSRKRLTACLNCVQAGVEKCESVAKEQEKQSLADTKARIEKVLTDLYSSKTTDEELVRLLPEFCKQIASPIPCGGIANRVPDPDPAGFPAPPANNQALPFPSPETDPNR